MPLIVEYKYTRQAEASGYRRLLLVKEYHQLCWWFQKALAMPSPAAAASLPCVRGGGQNL